MFKKIKQSIAIVSMLAILIAFNTSFFIVQKADAAGFQENYVRLDRLATATSTTGLVCVNPTTTSSANVDVQLVIPTVAVTDFTVSTTGSKWAASTTDIPVGTTAWPGIAAATPTASGHTITWTYSGNQTLTSGTTYCFRWTDETALTTGAAGNNQVGSITTRTTSAATIDSGSYALSVISNDQITINATVPPIFTFNFTGGTDNFPDLSTTTASTSGKTATISTNAANGWTVWVKSVNAGLDSASTGASIDTAGTVNGSPDDLSGMTGYVLDVNITTDSGTAGTGTVSIAGEYNGTNTTSGGTLSTIYQPVASANGITDGDTITLIERAKVLAIQAAANDYTDTLTVVAAGLF